MDSRVTTEVSMVKKKKKPVDSAVDSNIDNAVVSTVDCTIAQLHRYRKAPSKSVSVKFRR